MWSVSGRYWVGKWLIRGRYDCGRIAVGLAQYSVGCPIVAKTLTAPEREKAWFHYALVGTSIAYHILLAISDFQKVSQT